MQSQGGSGASALKRLVMAGKGWRMAHRMAEAQHARHVEDATTLKGTSSSCLKVSQPRRRKPWARIPHCIYGVIGWGFAKIFKRS